MDRNERDLLRTIRSAFRTPSAYNNWIFASGLPDDIELKLLYAGEGTL